MGYCESQMIDSEEKFKGIIIKVYFVMNIDSCSDNSILAAKDNLIYYYLITEARL